MAAFDQATLDAAVKEAFATATDIPADHTSALVLAAGQDGASVILARRLDAGPDPWVIAGQIDHPWSGGLDYGVTISKTW